MALGEAFVVSLILAIVLAALGLRIAGGEAWKGGVLGVVFIAGTALGGTITQSMILLFVVGLVAVGLVAGAMKIPAKQSANAVLGCVLGFLTPIFFI